jgi:hypothetical protein
MGERPASGNPDLTVKFCKSRRSELGRYLFDRLFQHLDPFPQNPAANGFHHGHEWLDFRFLRLDLHSRKSLL